MLCISSYSAMTTSQDVKSLAGARVWGVHLSEARRQEVHREQRYF